MKNCIRLFICTRCQAPVLICSDCDRGNIYCGPKCSRAARTRSCHRANQRYQQTHRGRSKHAQRQRRYRQRQHTQKKIVTDQGSPKIPLNDLLSEAPLAPIVAEAPLMRCHFCGEPCSPFVRQGYLTQRFREKRQNWPQGP